MKPIKNSRFILTILCFLIISFSSYAKDIKTVEIHSPDKKITYKVEAKKGTLTYSVFSKEGPLIEKSLLGLNINGKSIASNSVIKRIERYKLNESYPYRGVHSIVINNFRAAKIHINSVTSSFVLEVKVFNDGVAFRYLIDNSGEALIDQEFTNFILPIGSKVWSQPNNKAYEGSYTEKLIQEFKKDKTIGPPATILLPNLKTYIAITEAGLTDFAGMSLIADGNRGFQAMLFGDTRKTGNIATPWRVIEIGKDLNTLVNCDIIANVSPTYVRNLFPNGYDTDWVKPGRSVWSWLAGKENWSITLENMKRFSDMAAELGFEYNLVDEGWGNWKDGDRDKWDMMKELVDYSAKKGVKIWVWKAYPDRNGIAGIKDVNDRIAFFEKCKAIGVVGLKIDFFDNESQPVIDFYQAALKDGAKYHLMLDFHGANKPTGETRTWPNEMTREAIMGLESRPPWAKHQAIIPFTRYLAGHADYTPVNFGDRKGEVSWAHHIASMAIFTSPFLCLGADPQTLIDNPFKKIITSIPSTWDETIVLPQSKIGELVLYARRKGELWFLAAMNGTHEKQALDVELKFLGNGNYQLQAVKDDTEKQASGMALQTEVKSKSKININLNPEGGFIGRFEKIK